jgi:translocator protein
MIATATPARPLSVAMLVLFLVLVGLTGWVGSAATLPAVAEGWYDGLAKPPFTPPAALFGPVWTVLYVAMAVAAWLVWRRGGFAQGGAALALWLGQLVLNGLWSVLFFGLRRPTLALVDIAVLLLVLAATIAAFARIRPGAAWLLAPYLAWSGFAAVLNGWIAAAN